MHNKTEIDGISIEVIFTDDGEEKICHIADWLKAKEYTAESESEFKEIMMREGLEELEIDELWDEILEEYHQFCWDNNLTPDVYEWY